MPTPRDLTRVSVPLGGALKSFAAPLIMPLAQSHLKMNRRILGALVQTAASVSPDEEKAAASYARAFETPPSAEAAEYMRKRLASRSPRRRRGRAGD